MKPWQQFFKNRQVWLLIGYLAIIGLIRWRFDLTLLFWLIGGVLGWCLVALDRLVWVYWTKPETQLATQTRYLVANKRYQEARQTLQARREEQTELSFRSVLFQLAWVPLAFFTLTSTASFFGRGLVMCLGLHILYDQWCDYCQSPEKLRRWLFWQIKRPVSLEEQQIYLWLMTAVFVILNRLLI